MASKRLKPTQKETKFYAWREKRLKRRYNPCNNGCLHNACTLMAQQHFISSLSLAISSINTRMELGFFDPQAPESKPHVCSSTCSKQRIERKPDFCVGEKENEEWLFAIICTSSWGHQTRLFGEIGISFNEPNKGNCGCFSIVLLDTFVNLSTPATQNIFFHFFPWNLTGGGFCLPRKY